jgi:hypothetical protein
MKILGKFIKQPVEVQDYDVDFNEYLTGHTDTAATFAVVAEPGLTIMASSLAGGVVKVFGSGGVDGVDYKVSATITTAGGRIKQGDFVVKVREF